MKSLYNVQRSGEPSHSKMKVVIIFLKIEDGVLPESHEKLL